MAIRAGLHLAGRRQANIYGTLVVASAANSQRLRLRVDGIDDAVFDWEPDDVPTSAGQRQEVRPLTANSADRAAGQRRYEVTVDGWIFRVTVEDAGRAILRERAAQGRTLAGHQGEQVVKAQIPGRLVRLWVADGDTVEAGQRLLAIEAMKMENEVRAPRAGTIASVKAAVGSSVELGDELLTLR